MYNVIVFRCQNGIVVWIKVSTAQRTYRWICTRDRFAVSMPTSVDQVEATLLALAQHAVSLSGAVLQVVELTV